MAKKAVKKKPAKKTAEEKVNKGFRNVPASTITKYDEIKESAIKKNPNATDADVLTLLIQNFTGKYVFTPDVSKYTQEIETLHDQILRTNKEKDLLELQITEQNNSLVTLKQKLDEFVKSNSGELLAEFNQAKQLISEQQIKILELETVNNPAEIQKLNDKIAELQELVNTGAASVDTIENLQKKVDSQKEDLDLNEKEIEKLNTALTDLKQNSVQLINNQFIADITDVNFELVNHYKIDLYKRKIISGNETEMPNEVINWAIKEALRSKFGKLVNQ